MDNKKLINILSMLAVFLVIPMMFSTFFDGYSIVSKGVQTNAPYQVSIFEYLNQRSVVLTFSFLFALVLVLAVLANIVYTIKLTINKENGGVLRFYFAIFIIVSAILTFVLTLVFCVSHTQSDGNSALNYNVGGCMILMLVCGLVIGILNLVCYFLANKKNNVEK